MTEKIKCFLCKKEIGFRKIEVKSFGFPEVTKTSYNFDILSNIRYGKYGNPICKECANKIFPNNCFYRITYTFTDYFGKKTLKILQRGGADNFGRFNSMEQAKKFLKDNGYDGRKYHIALTF